MLMFIITARKDFFIIIIKKNPHNYLKILIKAIFRILVLIIRLTIKHAEETVLKSYWTNID